MEEQKRLLGTPHSFHKASHHIPPLCVTVFTSSVLLTCVFAHPASAMRKQNCTAGSHWDTLVNACVKVRAESLEPKLTTGEFHWSALFLMFLCLFSFFVCVLGSLVLSKLCLISKTSLNQSWFWTDFDSITLGHFLISYLNSQKCVDFHLTGSYSFSPL